MPSNQIMILAGEASGDRLAAELVKEIRRHSKTFPPHFFGLGGAHLREAGVEILEDMTEHAVFGLSEVLRHYRKFKKILDNALFSAQTRLPDLILLVDFGGFNLRFAKAIRSLQKSQRSPFLNWNPKIAYFIPPQVWASRAGRARTIAETIDLVISIFAFEKAWYEARFPHLPLIYVGDPMSSYFSKSSKISKSSKSSKISKSFQKSFSQKTSDNPLRIVILPGSRAQEIRHHLPIFLESIREIAKHKSCKATIITPNSTLAKHYKKLDTIHLLWKTGNLDQHLQKADIALASSGMVTRECAYLGVPAVVIYKVSWITYQIAKRMIRVKFIAMPNILAGKMIFPELIQNAATPSAIASAVLEICQSKNRENILAELHRLALSLHSSNANATAAKAIMKLLDL